MIKIAIIGGGPSGMFSAITALSSGKQVKVTIFEQMNRVGKKILATGNGRCNITNEFANKINDGIPVYYHGNDPSFAIFSLQNFNQNDLISFFEKNGLILRKENDKYYPYTEQAGTILDFLRLKCEMLGVEFSTQTKIEKISFENDKFHVNNKEFDKVIVACGGKSSPHLGSDGSGYVLLESFGHHKTKLFPAITQVKTETEYVKQLKGIKVDALCKIYVEKELKREEYGQVLFAEYGLSGPPIFQLSRVAGANYDKNCHISLDFMKDFSVEEIVLKIKSMLNNPYTYPFTCENLLSLLLNKRLGQIIVKYCGFKLSKDSYELTECEINNIAFAIKNFKICVNGVNSFQNAQVTAGGIKTEDFCDKTMESKIQKGLYACGEILDIDGDCGGFNLQWAFSSGYVAGLSAIGESLC